MAGIKDPKVATKKNKEFRNKTKAWVAREAERRGIKNRNYEHELLTEGHDFSSECAE